MSKIQVTEADEIGDADYKSDSWYAVKTDSKRRPLFTYRIPDDAIEVVEPPKPPVFCLVRNEPTGTIAWAFRLDKYDVYAISPEGWAYFSFRPTKVTVIDNPHNDPALAARIRAAKEGK